MPSESAKLGPTRTRLAPVLLPLLASALVLTSAAADEPGESFASRIQPLLRTHCLECHSAADHQGDLDLERFSGIEHVRNQAEIWQTVLLRIKNNEMPPQDQPPLEEPARRELMAWINAMLDAEALRRAGDPGPALVRRLNNAEYDYAVADLTGVDLNPSQRFPADGAAGEGFLNATEALAISSEQMGKYLDAAKDVAAHAVLLPDGIRFSESSFNGDWSNDVLGQIVELYRSYSNESGQIPLDRYLSATLRHRGSLESGQASMATIAKQEQLSPKYLQRLWDALHDDRPTLFVGDVVATWQSCQPNNVDSLAENVTALQALLWHKRDPVGRHALDDRFVPPGIVLADRHAYRLHLPSPQDGKIRIYIASQVFGDAGPDVNLILEGARLESQSAPPISLREAVEKSNSDSQDQSRLQPSRFGVHPSGKQIDENSFVLRGSETLTLEFEPSVVAGREFVVDVRIDSPTATDAIAHFDVRLSQAPPRIQPNVNWTDVAGPFERKFLSGDSDGEQHNRLNVAADQFRQLFPARVCYPGIWVRDTTVTLERYHRGDTFLSSLLLSDSEHARLERLWEELHFISRDALQVRASYATVTQGELSGYKEVAEVIQRQAEETENAWRRAEPDHLQAVLELATRAYRRPLGKEERKALADLYQSLRRAELPHEESIRAVLARVLVSPHFLYRFESAPTGTEPDQLSDWELATRLSFFLWASVPDAGLRQAARAGQLHEPDVLRRHVERMLKDDRIRRLAVEFGTQWLEVRNFDQFTGKNDKLFPQFDAELREAMNEESVLMFQHLFQNDLPIFALVDADHTFVNATLARHYGLPDVQGSELRLVTGTSQLGRGGILTLGSVLSKHSGASRTSPVLRGNWIAEALLGEQLPLPPDGVPELPDAESQDGLSVRQLVEQHAHVPGCIDCHQRIDPLGFALEEYDTIGQRRDRDTAGRPIDAHAELRDGTQFDGIEGLREYLLGTRNDEFVRQFCRKLLGYALGRRVILSDRMLLNEMASALEQHQGRVSAAIIAIVQSKQFQSIRGTDFGGQR